MKKTSKIIHIDMDAFYASVEQRDQPELRGKPVIVGGDPNGRGVVAACSYEARKFGIHSAMSAAKAYKRCPNAVFLKPRMNIYKTVSAEIKAVFYEYTDLVEPLSLDEAFLDVTENKKNRVSATQIAQEIRAEIYKKTSLTASAGVSFNKFLAKTASDMNKPNGITVITPDQADRFIDTLPIRKFFGVGKVTEKKMHSLGIKTGADLKQMTKNELVIHFGKAGRYFHNIAHAKDNRPVVPNRARKSVGRETTFTEDIDNNDQMTEILWQIALQIENLLKKHDVSGMTVTLKVRYSDFQTVTRSVTHTAPISEAKTIMDHVRPLLANTEAQQKKVRLLGITVSNFVDAQNKIRKYRQLLLPFL